MIWLVIKSLIELQKARNNSEKNEEWTLNPIQDGGVGGRRGASSYHLSPVKSINVKISCQKLLSFSFNPFSVFRTVAPEEIRLPTIRLTLTLTWTLILTRSQFFSRAIVWLPPNPKTDHTLDLNPNPNRGRGQFSSMVNCPDTLSATLLLN